MRAVIPAAGERIEDVVHVATRCRRAGMTPVVVWQGKGDPEMWLDGIAQVRSLPSPVGKGAAVKVGLRGAEGEPFAVVDADLHGVAERPLTAVAAHTVQFPPAVVRGTFRSSGRTGRFVDEWVRQFGLMTPDLFTLVGNGGLLSGLQGYGVETWKAVDPFSGPDGYGWDLWMALRLAGHAGEAERVVTIPLGERRRLHRPNPNPAHIKAQLRQNLDVLLDLTEVI